MEEQKTLVQILHDIQKNLKAPKGQENKFGGYKYRSCEDILEAVKRLLPDGVVVTVRDEIVQIGDRYYVKAEAEISDGKRSVVVPAFAREPQEKKGMDASQITGATSSYARKYALNGLFCIDDTKDADATNDHKDGKEEAKEYKREDKIFQRDFLYGLGKCYDEKSIASYVLAWTDDLPKIPEYIADVLKDATNNRIAAIKNGVKFTPSPFGYIDVQEAVDFATLAKIKVDTLDSGELYEWFEENADKLKALDEKLTAAKYQTPEGTPYKRLLNAYNKRMPQAAE